MTGFHETVEELPGVRRIVLPKTVVNEALSGGFSSLWLPAELGFLSTDTGYDRSFPSGAKFLAVGFCTYGHGWFEYGKKRYNLAKGRICIALPGLPHACGSEPGERFDFYWIHIVGSRIAWFRNLLPGEGNIPTFPARDDFSLRDSLEELFALLSGDFSKTRLDRASLVLGRLLADLYRGQSVPGERQSTLTERLDRIIVRMKSRLNEELKINELAALCNVSLSYFSAGFKHYTGYRVSEYFTRLKMEKARELLDTTDLPVKEIAVGLAYSDQLYFSRSFRRITGCSPLAWRNRERSTQ